MLKTADIDRDPKIKDPIKILDLIDLTYNIDLYSGSFRYVQNIANQKK